MITKRISVAVALAAFILAAAAVLDYAQGRETISADAARRTMQVLIGLILAFYCNFLPKDMVPLRGSGRAASRWQLAGRVGGWSLTLAGVAHAGLWAFAPIDFAHAAAMIVVASATLLTLGYAGWAGLSCRRIENSSTI
jgi:hypothetical protein